MSGNFLERLDASQQRLGWSRPAPQNGSRRAAVSRGMARADLAGLRPHQAEIVRATAARNGTGAAASVCVAPTGSGKTEVFLSLVAGTCLAEPGRLEVPHTVILVPTRHLVTQTVDRLRLRHPQVPVGFLDPARPAGPVCVGTYDAFATQVLDGRLLPGDIDHLVLDEAHRALSPTRAGIVARAMADATVSAYSASPAYSLMKHVYALLGRDSVVAEISTRSMIDAGVVAPFVNYVLRVPLTGPMPAGRALRHAVLDVAASRAALAFRREFVDPALGVAMRDKAFLAYARDVEAAREAADAFALDAGERCLALSGRDPSARQKDALAELAGGGLDGIMNAKLLAEGLDCPRVGMVLNLAPTASLVHQLQRCGRGLRIDPSMATDDPRQVAAIVDVMFVHGGRPVGRPRFFHEAIEDPTLSRLVPMRAQDLAEIESGLRRRKVARSRPGHPGSGRPGEQGYEINGIAYVLRAGPVTEPDVVEAGAGTGEAPWLRLVDVRRALGLPEGTRDALSRAWRGLAALAASGLPTVVEGEAIRFRSFVRANRGPSGLLHPDDLGTIRTAFGSGRSPWVGKSHARARFNLPRSNRDTFSKAWSALARQAASGAPTAVDGTNIRFKAAVRPGRSPSGFIHADDLETLRGLLPGLESPWMPLAAVRRAAGLPGKQRDWLSRLWHRLAAEAVEGRVPMVGGTAVRFKGIPYRGRFITGELHAGDLAAFLEAARGPGTPGEAVADAGDDWLTKADIVKTQGIRRSEVGKVFDHLLSLSKAGERAMLGGSPVRFEQRRRGRASWPALHREHLPDLLRHLGIAAKDAPVTGDWLTYSKACKRLVTPPGTPALTAAWDRMASGLPPVEGGTPLRFEYRLHPGSLRSVPCLHAHELHPLRLALGDAIRRPGKEWRPFGYFLSKLRLGDVGGRAAVVWDGMEAELRRSGRCSLLSIPVSACIRDGEFRVHFDFLDVLATAFAAAGVGAATKRWLSVREAAEALGTRQEDVRFADAMRRVRAASGVPRGTRDQVSGLGVVFTVKPEGRGERIEIARTSLPALAGLAGFPWPPVPRPSQDWLDRGEMLGRVLSRIGTRAFEAAWSALPTATPAQARASLSLVEMRMGPKLRKHIHASQVEAFLSLAANPSKEAA